MKSKVKISPFLLCVFVMLQPRSLIDVQCKLTLNSPMPPVLSAVDLVEQGRKIPLSLIAIVTYGGDANPQGPIATQSIQLALNGIRNSGLLDKFDLSIEMLDDKCTRYIHVKQFINALESNSNSSNRLPIILGGLCGGHLYTTQMIKSYNFVMVNIDIGTSEMFTNRLFYSNLFLLYPRLDVMVPPALAALCVKFGWKQLTMLTEELDSNRKFEAEVAAEFSKNNISFINTVKVHFNENGLLEDADLISAVESLKALQPRVIYFDGSYPEKMVCLFYKYKLYGPGFVYLYGTTILPSGPLRYPWCSPEMVKTDIVGSPLRDSIGNTGEQYTKFLADNVEEPEKLFSRFRLWHYDFVVAAAFLLNATESILNKDNDSLTSWFVNEERFKRNGSYIVDVMKEAVKGLRFRTLNQDIEMDSTGVNRQGGYAFFQTQPTDDVLAMDGSAIVDGLKRVHIFVTDAVGKPSASYQLDKPVWDTLDGGPPIDAVRTLLVYRAPLDVTAYSVLAGISCRLIICNVVFFVYLMSPTISKIKYRISFFDHFGLVANIILAAHAFALPGTIKHNIVISCATSYILLAVGLSAIVASLTGKFESLRTLRLRLRRSQFIRHKRTVFNVLAIVPVMVAILTAVWFAVVPLEINSSSSSVMVDYSLQFTFTFNECHLPGRNHEYAWVQYIVIAGILLIHLRLITYCVISSIDIKKSARRQAFKNLIASYSSGIAELTMRLWLLITIMAFAIVVSAAIYSGRFDKTAISISASALAIVTGNTLITLYQARVSWNPALQQTKSTSIALSPAN